MKRKGSSEITSLVLIIVLIGALALAVGGSLTKQTSTSLNAGLNQQTTQLGTNYTESSAQRPAVAPTF